MFKPCKGNDAYGHIIYPSKLIKPFITDYDGGSVAYKGDIDSHACDSHEKPLYPAGDGVLALKELFEDGIKAQCYEAQDDYTKEKGLIPRIGHDTEIYGNGQFLGEVCRG